MQIRGSSWGKIKGSGVEPGSRALGMRAKVGQAPAGRGCGEVQLHSQAGSRQGWGLWGRSGAGAGLGWTLTCRSLAMASLGMISLWYSRVTKQRAWN